MADQREVFTIVEDISTEAGIKLPGRAQGDAAGSNHIPAMVAKDSSGNYQLIELRQEGDAAATLNSFPSLAVKDSSGNLQYINARDVGDSITGVDALPAFIAKDPSDQFAYLKLNANGELVVSSESVGTRKSDQSDDAASVGSYVDGASITLTASKLYEKIEWTVANTFPTLWQLVGVEDKDGTPVESVLAEAITGPGQFTFGQKYEHIDYTAGTTGTLALYIRGKQLTGAASQLHSTIAALEEA